MCDTVNMDTMTLRQWYQAVGGSRSYHAVLAEFNRKKSASGHGFIRVPESDDWASERRWVRAKQAAKGGDIAVDPEPISDEQKQTEEKALKAKDAQSWQRTLESYRWALEQAGYTVLPPGDDCAA